MDKQAKITITEASKLAGISRTAFYKSYINKGVISVIRENKSTYIDISELLRVFPDIQLDVNKNTEVNMLDVTLERENQLLRNQLKLAEDREIWLQSQIDELRKQQSLLLEDKSTKKNRKKWFGIW